MIDENSSSESSCESTIENDSSSENSSGELNVDFDKVQEASESSVSKNSNENFNVDFDKVQETSESSKSQKKHEKSEKTTEMSNYMYESELENKMKKLSGSSQETLKSIDKENLVTRIKENNTLNPQPEKLHNSDADSAELEESLKEMSKEDRKKYLDSAKAKGYLQEEMLKSVLSDDFTVSDKTEKSVHEDGSITYTDIVASDAKNDIVIGNTIVKQGETIEIESKAGDEKYLASQLEHINKQLEGMDDNSHKFLVVTADYDRMSESKKEQLINILDENDAEMIVMPYYASDLQNNIMHMDIQDNSDEILSENDESEDDMEIEETFMESYRSDDIERALNDIDSTLGIGTSDELMMYANELQNIEPDDVESSEKIKEKIDAILEDYQNEKEYEQQ